MRRRTPIALLSAFLTTGCLVPRHESLATPHDAVLTFQSAWAHDDEFREYDCLARSMKEGRGLDQQKWSLARGPLFAPLGALGRFVLRRDSLADDLLGGTLGARRAELVYSLWGRTLVVALEPESVVALPAADGTVADHALASFALTPARKAGEPQLFTFAFAVANGAAAELAARGAPWLELHSLWKIADVTMRAEPPAALAPLAVAPAEAATVIPVAALRFELGASSFGVTRVTIALPFDPTRATSGVLRWEAAPAPR